VLPVHLAAEVAKAALEQEELEVFIREKLAEGRLLQDVYPPNDAVRRDYEERVKRKT
jgi:regulator of RNase E activity RraA